MSDLIQRALFDVAVDSTAQGALLQQRISEFAASQLHTLLAECMAPFASDDTVFAFDRIELDLGQIDEARLETQLGERLRAALDAFFRSKMVAFAPASHASQMDLLAQQRPLLDVLQGKTAQPELEVLLQAALAEWPQQLVQSIRSLGRQHAVRQRLARLPDALLGKLVLCLNPADAALVNDYAHDVQVAHRQRPILALDGKAFSAELWEFILAALLLERGSYFNTKALAAYTLRKMASRHQLPYAQLLARLTECVQTLDLPLTRRHSLPQILLELLDETGLSLTALEAVKTGDAGEESRALTHDRLSPALAGERRERGLVEPWAAILRKNNAARMQPHPLPNPLPQAGEGTYLPFRDSRNLAREPADSFADDSDAILLSLPALHQHGTSQSRKNLACIAHFLQHGDLPWVSWQGKQLSFSALVKNLIETDPDALAALVRQLGKQHKVRMRLANQLPDEVMQQIIDQLEPQQAPWIRQAVRQIRAKQAPVVQDDSPRFARVLWQFVLHCLLLERGSYFNTRSFIKSLLQQMAAHYAITYQTLLRNLISHAVTDQLPAAHALPAILLSLQRELDAPERAQPSAQPAAVSTAATPLGQAIEEFVQQTRQVERGSHFNNRSYIHRLLQQLAARHSLAFEDLLSSLTPPAPTAVAPGSISAILLELKAESATKLGQHDAASASAASAAEEQAQAALVEAAGLSEAELALQAACDFLQFGSMSAAARALPSSTLQHILQLEVLLQHPSAWPALLKAANQHEAMIARILRYLPQQQLPRLLLLLAPTYAGLIQTWLLAGAALANAPDLPPGQKKHLQKQQWQALLQFLFARQGRDFSLLDFLAETEKQLVRQLAMPNWRQRLREQTAQQALQHARYQALLDLLDNSALPAPAATTPQAAPVAEEVDDSGSVAAVQLQQCLQYGELKLADMVAVGCAKDAAITLEQALKTALATLAAPAMRSLLLPAAGSEPERLRMSYLLSPALREQALQVLLQQDHAAASWWRTALLRALSVLLASGAKAGWESLLAEELFQQLHQAAGRRLEFARYLQAVIQRLARQLPARTALPQQLLAHLQTAIKGHTGAQPSAQVLQQSMEKLMQQMQSAAGKSTPATPAQTSPSQVAAKLATHWPITKGESMKSDTISSTSGFFVNNAGQVILWPYLERFFSMQGLLEGKRFKGFRQQCHAVHLLQWLTTGILPAAEHDLLLNKVLCGMALDEVLEVTDALTPAEQEMGQQLLHAVTQHWDKLKNTSIDGLRETFLVRQGKLVQQETQWQLTVEQSSFDVLITTLPWSLAMIRLPWMEQMLQVKWR